MLTNTCSQLTQNTESTEPAESQEHMDDTGSNTSMQALEDSDTRTLTSDPPATEFNNTRNKKSTNNDLEAPQGKRKKNLSSQIISAIQKGQLERETLMSQLTAGPPTAAEDEIDILFKSLALTVKKFPPLLRAQTKSRIFQVISDAELQLLRPEPPVSRLSTYSYESNNSASLPMVSPTDAGIPEQYANQQSSSATAQYLENFQVNNYTEYS